MQFANVVHYKRAVWIDDFFFNFIVRANEKSKYIYVFILNIQKTFTWNVDVGIIHFLRLYVVFRNYS